MPAWGQYRKQGGLEEVPMAMADMFAGAGRGVVRGTLGLPGDIESLGRLFVGGEQSLPTSEDWDKKLPPMTPLIPYKGRSPFDSITQFYNLPIYGGAINALGKGVSKAAAGTSKALGYNPMRRKFMKDVGALTAAGVVGSKLSKLADDVAPPIEKLADDAAPAAKAATKYKYNSLKEYNDALNEDALYRGDALASQYGGDSSNFVKAEKSKLAKAHEEAYNLEKDKINSSLIPEDHPYTVLHDFSPQAKAEMNELKRQKGSRWIDYIDDGVSDLEKYQRIYPQSSLREYNDYLKAYGNGYHTVDTTRLAEREAEAYKAVKGRQTQGLPQVRRDANKILETFSPQAKAEMNIFKNRFNQFADDVYAPDEPRNFATYLDSYINGEADQFFPAFNDKYIPF